MSNLEHVDNYETLVLGGSYRALHGFSVSSIATYVTMDGVDAVFDLGHCPSKALTKSNVFLSHVHADHMGGVPTYVARRHLRKMSRGTIYVPHESAEHLRDVLMAFQRLEGGRSPESDVRGVRAGEAVVFQDRRYSVQIVPADHVLPSVGYVLFERRSRTPNPPLSVEEIHRRLKAKESVKTEYWHPMMTFIGDSTVKALTTVTAKSDILVMECTFVDDDHREHAFKHGHTHIQDLVDVMNNEPERISNPVIVLKHQSLRYGREEFRDKVMAKVPDAFKDRIKFLTARA